MQINPPTLFWIIISAIFAVERFFPLMRFTEPWILWGGIAVFVFGVGVSVAGKNLFERIGTNVYTFEEPGELVTEGVFSISRNPMYLGLVLAVIGAAMVSRTLAALVLSALFAVIVRYCYVAYEERAMRRKFGDPYEAYCRSVRRWIGRRRSVG